MSTRADGPLDVVTVEEPLDPGRGDARGRVLTGQPFVDDLGDLRVLADDDEHGRPGIVLDLFPRLPQVLPKTGQHGHGGAGILEDGLRLGVRLFSAPFGRRQLGQDPAPDVEIARDLGARRVAHGELGDLDQPRLDRVGQAEVAHHPGEDPVRILAYPAEEIGRRGEVEAEVDPAQPVDPVETVHPDGGLPEEFLDLLLFPEKFPLHLLRLGFADAVGMVGLVVEHEDIPLPTDLAAEHAVDEGCVALDILDRLDDHLSQVPLLVLVLGLHLDETGRDLPVQFRGGEVPLPAGRRGLHSDGDRLLDTDGNPGLHHLRAHAAGLDPLGFEDVPVGDQHPPLVEVGH